MQAVSGCGSLLCLGHALAQCSGVARPSSTLATAVQTSCAHRMCSIPVWQLSTATASLGPGGYGFGSGFACEVRHRTAHAPRPSPGIAQPMCSFDVCVVCCHRILAASRASSSQWSGGRRISTRSSRRAAFDEPRVHASCMEMEHWARAESETAAALYGAGLVQKC